MPLHTHASTDVYTDVCIHIYTHVYMHIYTHVYMHVYTHVHTHVSRLVSTHVYAHDQAHFFTQVDTASPTVLADFIARNVKSYPADRYGLIMWNHGASWTGMGYAPAASG